MQQPYTDALDSLNNDELKTLGRMLKLVFAILDSEPEILNLVWERLHGISELAEDPDVDEKISLCAKVIADYDELSDRVNNIAKGRISRLN